MLCIVDRYAVFCILVGRIFIFIVLLSDFIYFLVLLFKLLRESVPVAGTLTISQCHIELPALSYSHMRWFRTTKMSAVSRLILYCYSCYFHYYLHVTLL
jgi:hypothetical protein